MIFRAYYVESMGLQGRETSSEHVFFSFSRPLRWSLQLQLPQYCHLLMTMPCSFSSLFCAECSHPPGHHVGGEPKKTSFRTCVSQFPWGSERKNHFPNLFFLIPRGEKDPPGGFEKKQLGPLCTPLKYTAWAPLPQSEGCLNFTPPLGRNPGANPGKLFTTVFTRTGTFLGHP